MKKNVFLFLFFIILIINVKANGTQESTPIQADLIAYKDVELSTISDLDSSVTALYASVTGENFKDDKTLFEALKTQIIPESKELITATEAITTNLNTREIQNLNEIYVESLNERHNACCS